jgi:uncharacterized protein
MMMALGQFMFQASTVAHQELQRQTAWRHPSNSRVGARPARQFVGPGDDTLTLQGVLYPAEFGSAKGLADLREMGKAGLSWPLVDGAGNVYGSYVIESLHETKTVFVAEGLPRKIEFQLSLACVDDAEPVDAVGSAGSTVEP